MVKIAKFLENIFATLIWTIFLPISVLIAIFIDKNLIKEYFESLVKIWSVN